jgi:hypothetical protein
MEDGMTTTSILSRRTLVASAAALPALAVPALATSAAAATVSPPPVTSGGQIICESGASDAEITALAQQAIELCEAHKAACTASNAPEKKYFEWHTENPVPTDDAELAKWKRRKRDAKRRSGFRTAEIARDRACHASADAINTLIATRPRTFAGLAIKAKTMKLVDDADFFDWRFGDEILAMTGEPVAGATGEA